MSTSTWFVDWLENELTIRDWGQVDLAKRARLSQAGVSKLMSGDRKPGIDAIIGIARAFNLSAYELKGINVMDPPPSQVIRTFQGKRKVVIVEGILQEIRDAREKAGMATTTTRSKLAQYTKVLQIIRDYKNEYPDLPVLARSESTVVRAMADLQLAAYLQEAEKAEIKGNRKKALDQYYEAMYFLQHDNVDDKLQAAQLTRIEAKIKELSSAGP